MYLDQATQTLYWVEGVSNADASRIKKSTISNFNPQNVVIINNLASYIRDLWVSNVDGLVYWVNSANSSIIFNNLNDTENVFYVSTTTSIDQFCIDETNNRIFLGNSSGIIYDGNDLAHSPIILL